MVGEHGTTEHYSSILQVTKNDGDVEGGNARVFLFYTPYPKHDGSLALAV